LGFQRRPEVCGQLRVSVALGRGKKIGGGMNRAADLIVGGWETTGITTFQSGFPYSIQASDIQGVNNSPFVRANKVPGCNIHANLTQKLQRINPDCFTQPLLCVYGDTP